MSFFTKILGNDTAPSSRDLFGDNGFAFVGGSSSGVKVTLKTARQVPVVRDCLQVLSQSIAGLTFGIFQSINENETRKIANHPLYALLQNPNPETTKYEFFAELVEDCASGGDFFAEIIAGPAGLPGQLWRIDPNQVTVERLPNRDRRYKVRDERGLERVLLSEEVWHIRVPPLVDGLTGTSAILEGSEAIGAAIAVQNYSSAFFKNDATPPLLLKMEKSFADEESKINYLSAFNRWATGNNKHAPAILEHGIQVQQLSIAPEQAQFIETRRELDVSITRIWHIPPHKVGILDRATFSNIEQQSIEFVIDTLTPWLVLIESSIQKFLMIDPDRFFFRFNVASLLRGDLKARYEAYAIGRNWGFISVNEIRRLENMNGIGSEGDRYMEPLNMAPVGSTEEKETAMKFLRASVNPPRAKLELVDGA